MMQFHLCTMAKLEHASLDQTKWVGKSLTLLIVKVLHQIYIHKQITFVTTADFSIM